MCQECVRGQGAWFTQRNGRGRSSIVARQGKLLDAWAETVFRSPGLVALMMAGMGLEDYDAHRAFVQSLADIAKHSGAHIHLVAHLRKGSGPEYHPNANDIKGASEIGNLVSNIILVWANKPKFHSRSKGETVNVTDPDLRLIVDKQRNGSFEGHIGLFLHHTCLQFMERPMADAVLEMM